MKRGIRRSGRILLKMAEKGLRPRCAAVIVAAGTASRMGGEDKIFASLGGEPVLLRTLRVFQSCRDIHEITVVVRPERIEQTRAMCLTEGLTKVMAVVPGGETRVDSVLAGIAAVSPHTRLLAIHDGARPLVTEEVVARVVQEAARCSAAAPAVPVKDTVKLAERGLICATPDREKLYAVQTPQVFATELLQAALLMAKKKSLPITDDCSAVEALGAPIRLTVGSYENLKLTTPEDFCLAEALLRRRDAV